MNASIAAIKSKINAEIKEDRDKEWTILRHVSCQCHSLHNRCSFFLSSDGKMGLTPSHQQQL